MMMPFSRDIKSAMEELLQRGVHFGHKTARWNPKMQEYIYGTYNGVHIINLNKTLLMLEKAMKAMCACVQEGGRILFVGTKLQARHAIKEAALRCGQYYVNHRWLGGTLTNWGTISASIRTLRQLEEVMESEDFQAYTKKEKLGFQRRLEKYNKTLGGIRNMGGLPDMLFVVDICKENIAIKEAQLLDIPVMAIVDTNTDPTGITYPIPGNDDSMKAIAFYCDMMARAGIMGLEAEFAERPAPVESKAEDEEEEEDEESESLEATLL